MDLYDIFISNSKVDFIKKVGLEDWWESAFTPKERKYIRSRNKDLFTLENYDDVLNFLYLLASNLFTKNTEKHRRLAFIILKKAVNSTEDQLKLFDLYNLIIYMLDKYQDPSFYSSERLSDYCQKQIEISEKVLKIIKEEDEESVKLFNHHGYKILAKMKLKQGKTAEALSIAKTAKSQNWSGEWDKIICCIE